MRIGLFIYYLALQGRIKPANFIAFSIRQSCGTTCMAVHRPKQSRTQVHSYKPSSVNDIKSISIFKRLDGEVVSTNSAVQKRDGQKTWNFSSPGEASPQNQIPPLLVLVIRVGLYHSCTSETFLHQTYSLAAMGR